MTSSTPFASTGKLQVLPSNATLLLTPSINTGNPTQFIRQTSTQNGTFIQQPVSSGIMTTPSTSIVRLNHPQQNQGHFVTQSMWTNNVPQNSQAQQQFTVQKTTQPTSVLQYTTVKNEPGTPTQSSVIPTKVITQPIVRQTVAGQSNATNYTESQINDFVSKCRTFLTTLLRLAEKQAPEKLPMVRSCIQELLDGTIDPESFTQRLHTLYKSQPHVSLVPFFKLALPHMREIVKNTFGRPITIELLEKLQLPSSNSSNNTATTTITTTNNSTLIPTVANSRQGTAPNVVVNPSLLSQQQNSSVLQQPLYTTVQPQQKINILQQTTQPTLIGATGSLLSQQKQQQQQQQQARAQIFQSIGGIRPLVASLSTSSNPSLLTNHQNTQQVQPVTQMIIQPQTDSVLQRPFLSSTNPLQSTQIITVNHQPIKTETLHTHPTPVASLQQKTSFKIEEDYIDDSNRQLITDDRFVSAMNIRRRFNNDLDIRTSGIVLNDDAAFELISNGVRERLKYLLDQVRLIAQHRVDISMRSDSSYQTTSDVKSQIRFLEDLDKIEKQKKDKLEQEKILRAAKSRSKANDPEAAKLKQKAKEMQQAQVEEQRQKEANETALAAIGKPKKRKLEDNPSHSNQLTTLPNGSEQRSPIQPSPLANVASTNNINSKTKPAKRICRVNLRDLLLIMERDKYLKRTTLLVKALNK